LSIVTVNELIKAGMHFGHRASRWNPRMAPYIYGKRNLIHIINLKETIKGLITAYKFVVGVSKTGKDVLFVGTKRQARATIEREAKRCGMHFVAERWLGGSLTNFRTIRKSLSRLREIEQMELDGSINNYSKKVISQIAREKRKLKRNLEGIRNMDELPGALIVIDPSREHIAVKEANKLGIPTVCLADTNCDPDQVGILVPGNDDAMRAIEILCMKMADAVLEGKTGRPPTRAEAPAPPPAPAPAPTPPPSAPAPAAAPAPSTTTDASGTTKS